MTKFDMAILALAKHREAQLVDQPNPVERDLEREEVAALPDFEREVYELWRYERCSPSEIALAVKSTETAVQQAILRAAHRVRIALEPEAHQ